MSELPERIETFFSSQMDLNTESEKLKTAKLEYDMWQSYEEEEEEEEEEDDC